MSCKLEPAIWPRYTGQRIPCFDRCQLIRTWISNIKEVQGKPRLHVSVIYAGWEVLIVKNCDRGLENAARGRRPRAAFSSPRSQFFTIRTDPKPVNNISIFFSCGKLAYKLVCLRNFLVELAYVPSSTHHR